MKPLLVHTPDLLHYSFGEEHPMGPRRVRLAMDLAEYFGVLEAYDLKAPIKDVDGLLRTIHEDAYLRALEDGDAHPEFGIGDHEHPVVPALPRVAKQVVAATVTAVQAVWRGEYQRAVNLSGGLHHAAAGAQRGFCMYNDAAAGIQWLLDQGAQRVAYLDLDAHHGDGVEAMFWDDPRVLTVSVHESGLYLFPHTGFPHDIGGQAAAGTAVNIALPRDASDVEWLQAIHGIVPPILQRFRPEIIISQHGADPHRNDPLADLNITVDALSIAYQSVESWVEKFAGGKWVAIGGGGYHRDSVARTWATLLSIVAAQPLEMGAAMPANWLEQVATPVPDYHARLGDAAAESLLAEFDPARVFTHAACAPMATTSKYIFPYWGLEPYRQHI